MLFLSRFGSWAYVLLASAWCFTAVNADSASDALASIPACGLQCIAENLPAIGCGLMDVECQCNSKNSTKILQPCLEQLCTYEETFSILHVQATLCNRPHDNVGYKTQIVAYVNGIIPVLIIVMRFTSRRLGRNKLWWDDWLHLVSVILVVPMTAALLMTVENGLGRHVWDMTYPQVVAVQKWTYISVMFWGFELLILKYSILCLYLRCFPHEWLNRAIYAFMAFTACFTLPLIGLAAFQCIPVSAIWDLQQRKDAKCIDWITVMRLTVVYEIIAEVVLFTLPIPIVWQLQMKTSKKIQLSIFFGLGVCVIATSIARVPFLPGVVDTVDPTYTISNTSITGYTSSGVAHVCAAVPTLKYLFKYCINGFNHDIGTKASSVHVQDPHDSNSKRSYKSLQDSKNSSNLSSKGSSRKRKDPYRITNILKTQDDEAIVELNAVSPRSVEEREILSANTSPDSSVRTSAKTSWRNSLEKQFTNIRKTLELERDDSASNKSILPKHAYP